MMLQVLVTDNTFKGSGLSSSSSLVVASALMALGYVRSFLGILSVHVMLLKQFIINHYLGERVFLACTVAC